VARLSADELPRSAAARTISALRERAAVGENVVTWTNACVAASSAVADAASRISRGLDERLVVVAGYLVDEDNHALFDSGRALSPEGIVRPFSADRRGLLLGDGVAAVVLESDRAARARGVRRLATVSGWGRAGDGYHVCQPDPSGRGMARAIERALARAGRRGGDVGYVNAHGTGTPYNDAGEAAGLLAVDGGALAGVPVSSTKALTGHTLEASGLVELGVAMLVANGGDLPVNAGFTEADPACPVTLVRRSGTRSEAPCVVTLNAAFGGANTALVVEAAA
jgi:3-oxoacyl-(acyl-carrier-protein) synthase